MCQEQNSKVDIPDGFDMDELEEIALESEKNFCDEQERIWGNCSGFISRDMVRHILLVIERRCHVNVHRIEVLETGL